MKKFHTTVHSSIKITLVNASLKVNGRKILNNLKEKRKELEPKFNQGHFVMTANTRHTFSLKEAAPIRGISF